MNNLLGVHTNRSMLETASRSTPRTETAAVPSTVPHRVGVRGFAYNSICSFG